MDTQRPAVAYCRVSTLEQKRRGYGIDIQTRDVSVFAEQQGFLVTHTYKDEAESGVAERRKALRRLLRDCRAGRVETVILPSLDRLSRNVRIAENLFHEFAELGVDVLIADMPTYNPRDRKDVLVRQIREAIAEENRKDIIERLWKGRQERVRRGFSPGGNVPYGYRREGKTWVVDSEEADIVRFVYESFGKIGTAGKVAQLLNEKGLARRNGKSWTPRQVIAILGRRSIYHHGLLRYGKVSGQDRALALLP